MEGTTTTVLLVEDYEGWREFARRMFQRHSELQVIGEASDGLQAVQKTQELQPDLIPLDIGLPILNGIEVARRIREVSPKSTILFVSENRSLDVVEKALSTGACGYVVKSDAGSELLSAIRAVLEGRSFVSASLADRELVTSEAVASGEEHRIDYNPYLLFSSNASIADLLASIIDATGADFGNVQLFDSTNHVLRIVAHHGFGREFLDYFESVRCDEGCACGRAMSARSRIVVVDVATDSLFSSDAKAVLMRANVGSIQSTPLIDSSGTLIGMVSTHYKKPGSRLPEMWKHVDDLAANFLATISA